MFIKKSIVLILLFNIAILVCLYGCTEGIPSKTGSNVSSSNTNTGNSCDKSYISSLSSSSSETPGIHVIPERFVRYIRPGISPDSLKRLADIDPNVNTGNWWIWEMTVESPDLVTPRGLKPGIGLVDALSRLGTGEIMYDLALNRDNKEIDSVMILKLDESGNIDEYNEMYLNVSEDMSYYEEKK